MVVEAEFLDLTVENSGGRSTLLGVLWEAKATHAWRQWLARRDVVPSCQHGLTSLWLGASGKDLLGNHCYW